MLEWDKFGGGNIMVCNFFLPSGHLLHRNGKYTTFWIHCRYHWQQDILGNNFCSKIMYAHSDMTRNFLLQNGIYALDRPVMPQDLSPIEHVWDELARHVKKGQCQTQNPQVLERAFFKEWQNIPLTTTRIICQSTERCLRAVINANGLHTRY